MGTGKGRVPIDIEKMMKARKTSLPSLERRTQF